MGIIRYTTCNLIELCTRVDYLIVKGVLNAKTIAKYLAKGDADRLSAWFSDNLEVTIFATSNDSSRNQARQIMKSFFKSYTPRSFEISHKAGRSNMKYALGTLNAGGEMFLVTIFVNYKDGDYKIQQLKIERID